MDYSVTYSAEFEAAHTIAGHPECARQHGHRYRVEVRSRLRYHAERRQVTDSEMLRKAVADIAAELNLRSLNEMIPAITTTPDGIASWFMERLMLSFPLVTQVTIWERPHCAFTVTREID